MNALRTWLAISGLLLFVLSFERFYREAIAYSPSEITGMRNQKPEPGEQKSYLKEKKDTIPSINGVITKLFGIEEIKMPEKPLTVVAPPPPPPPEPPPQMVLKGIILEPDGRYRAFIEIDGKKMLSLRAGEGVDNIIVNDIKERSVSLRWKDQTMELSIEPKRR